MPVNVKYQLDDQGRFVIEDYNRSKCFSNFFPGIAGIWGIPMWAFYVNRGQAIASFGIESKDKAILEFQPANRAYRQTSLQGFRTFLKIKDGDKNYYWEPFQNGLKGTEFQRQQTMLISPHDLTLREVNVDLGITVEVNYFTIPEESYSGLVRQVVLRNHSKKNYEIEIVDGLPVIVPYGLSDWLGKHLSRTLEAWTKVTNVDQGAPYYRLAVEVSDTSVVKHIEEGNFFFSFDAADGKLLTPVVESALVFGAICDFSLPSEFLEKGIDPEHKQHTANRTPSAMAYGRWKLPAAGSRTLFSIYGNGAQESAVNQVAKQVRQKNFISEKSGRNAALIAGIRDYALTHSASREFNLYAGCTFLDNIMRGGLPISVKTNEGNVSFNVFSRKHGDLERDYNFFTVAPTYYSQGNGNYRDVNQNRRQDVWFNTDCQDSHLVNFLNLVQADGYNPLVVKGTAFVCGEPTQVKDLLNATVAAADQARVQTFLENAFTPGGLYQFLDKNQIQLQVNAKEFFSRVIAIGSKQESADHGEGFWVDHWAYNLDLIESYLSLYPENLQSLVFERKPFSFYHNTHYVLPRDQRYVLTERGVRQYSSVCNGAKEIKPQGPDFRLRVKNGHGPAYQTHLFAKLLCLIANKIASLDPDGIGVEMEADKPSWYDALNGLPGLLGSSICETIEIKRFALFCLQALRQTAFTDSQKISLFEELAAFIFGLNHLLAWENDPLTYWSKSNDIKEQYRLRVREGISGIETELTVGEIQNFLKGVIDRVDKALAAAKTSAGFLPTYFYYEVTEHQVLENGGSGKQPFVRPVKFLRRELPLFLEGYVHALRVEPDPERAKALYTQIRQSPLFDEKLKMYKVNADISSQSEDIGRARVFPRGWLENESIWLHMEYKLMLELLRGGLVEEFYANFKNVFIPFLDARRYGRSILENSSFLVSSAHSDERLHGQGFVARLSGSTAEFLHIWLLMNLGRKPFALDEKKRLTLRFKPLLLAEMFAIDKANLMITDLEGKSRNVELPKNTYAFNLFGSTLVVYHNPLRKNTFGANAAEVKEIVLTYADRRQETITAAFLTASHAVDVRDHKIRRIDVTLK
ncbi:MAG: hypothetical protein HQL23_06445 [Candidatus Omnitrophica bacterium]|nr:hypothetical protein [Candidatus Omnitrophota bacterium]